MIKNVRAGIILFIAVLSLLSFDYSFADEYGIESDIEATGKLADIEGNEAKFNEYRDIREGLYGKVRLLYDSNYYFDFNASDIGYDTQRYRLDSGKWGSFKFYLDYNEIPHNFTLDRKSTRLNSSHGYISYAVFCLKK